MAIIKQQFTITYEREVDTNTGEILKTTIVNSSDIKKKTTKKVEDTDPTPRVTLLENKLQLNTAAIKALALESGDRVDIQYRDNSPIIGPAELFGSNGCKVTKTGSVSFRGKKAEELSNYGDCFELQPFDGGRFLLKGNKEPEKKPVGDENIELPTDLNLDDFLDDTKASMFQL